MSERGRMLDATVERGLFLCEERTQKMSRKCKKISICVRTRLAKGTYITGRVKKHIRSTATYISEVVNASVRKDDESSRTNLRFPSFSCHVLSEGLGHDAQTDTYMK